MDKLEKHIKEQLRSREISPSPGAWGKIAEALSSEKGTAPKKTYWWAIAAGIIGFMLLSIGFFSTKNTLETPSETIVVNEESNKGEAQEAPEEKNVIVNLEEPREALVIEAPLNKPPVPEPKNVEASIQLAENEAPNTKEDLRDAREVTDLAISDKLEEVLAQVTSMENNSIAISDKEIDSLLMAAQRELMAEKALGENGKVDAMALLNEVELELYDDQRNPLFIKLKEGFFMLRTAVADRNN